MQGHATFFITTARSGTQWLATALKSVYSDLARVEHEAIGYTYRPKLYLRAHDALEDLRSTPRVASHLRGIQADLEHRNYIEVGFPCFAAAPLLHHEFPQKLRLVQLVRHPVFAAASMVTHQWYRGTRTDNLESTITLQPSDAGVYQKEYIDRWNSMSTYERCLFYWTEVHQFAQEVRDQLPDVPFHTVRMEDLVRDPEYYLRDLVDFLGLPYREELLQWVGVRVDFHQKKTGQLMRWQQICDHPLTMKLASDFRYDIETINNWQFQRRYWLYLGWLQKMRKITGRATGKVKTLLSGST
jgi:hypothetical protein